MNAQTSSNDTSSLECFVLIQKQPAQAALAQISHKSASRTARSVGEKREGFSEMAREFLREQKRIPRHLEMLSITVL